MKGYEHVAHYNPDYYNGYDGSLYLTGDPNDFELQQDLFLEEGEKYPEGVDTGFTELPISAPPGFGGPESNARRRVRLVRESDSEDHAAAGLPGLPYYASQQVREEIIAQLKDIYKRENAEGIMYPKREQQILTRIALLRAMQMTTNN